MRHRAAFLIIVLLPVLLFGQMSVGGKWKWDAVVSTGVDHVRIDFKVEGEKLSGTITRSLPVDIAPVEFEGTIKDNVIHFTLNSIDGSRTIMFTGRVHGDEIDFTREVKGKGGGDGILGEYGALMFTAIRVK